MKHGKEKVKFAVGFVAGGKAQWIYSLKKFYLAKEYAEMLNGYVYIQHPEHGITDRIWPKEQKMFTWTDMNECLLLVSGLKKLPPQPMFSYRIICVGGSKWAVEYTGTDRSKAIAAYKEAKAWMGMAEVDIEVLGHKEKHDDLDEDDDDWDDDYDDIDEYNDQE